MSSSVVRQLHTEIRIAGSPCHSVPLIQHVPSRWTASITSSVTFVAIASEANQYLVEDHVVKDSDPRIARQFARP